MSSRMIDVNKEIEAELHKCFAATDAAWARYRDVCGEALKEVETAEKVAWDEYDRAKAAIQKKYADLARNDIQKKYTQE